MYLCNCGRHAPLIDGVCGECIRESRKDGKKLLTEMWNSMTQEERDELRFIGFEKRRNNA